MAAKAFSDRITLPSAPSLMMRIADSGMAVYRGGGVRRSRHARNDVRYLRLGLGRSVRRGCFSVHVEFRRVVLTRLVAMKPKLGDRIDDGAPYACALVTGGSAVVQMRSPAHNKPTSRHGSGSVRVSPTDPKPRAPRRPTAHDQIHGMIIPIPFQSPSSAGASAAATTAPATSS